LKQQSTDKNVAALEHIMSLHFLHVILILIQQVFAFTLLHVQQGGSNYQFNSLWFDMTWASTRDLLTQDKHVNHYTTTNYALMNN
jgi:hypothetical protein